MQEAKLSPTAYVVLGMLRYGPRSGYEIKQAVDRSTRFFWAASYSQIYPELRRLEAAGLVEGEPQPTGGRRRTVYRLTDAGREAMREWLDQPAAPYELRDESLLKLFFASLTDPQRALELIDERRRAHEAKLAELRAIEPLANSAPDPFPRLVLSCGIAFSEAAVAWCDRAEAELARELKSNPEGDSDA